MSEKIHSTQQPTYRYNLSEEHISDLTNELIEKKKFKSYERFVLYRVSGDDKYSDLGRQIERQVFEETFKGNDAEFMEREYGPYEHASLFFLSVDRQRKLPIGVLRIIKNSLAGLKTINDLSSGHLPVTIDQNEIMSAHEIDDWNTCWDVATLAVPYEYRRSGASASLQMYRAMYVTALDERIDHLVAIIDKAPLVAMTDYLAIPFVPLCGSDYFSYLESAESRAVYGHIPDFDRVINEKLAKVSDDLIATRALRKIIRGTEDYTLFLDDYKK